MRQWIDLPAADVQVVPVTAVPVARAVPEFITIRPPVMLPSNLRGQPFNATAKSPDRHDPLEDLVVVAVQPHVPACPAATPPAPAWLQRARARAARVCNPDVWASL
jgi:hypothetical protein